MSLSDSDEEEFVIYTDDPFPQNDTKCKFSFHVTWSISKSKIIISCKESSVLNDKGKIKSFTEEELRGIHDELSQIQPKIRDYFPDFINYTEVENERTETRRGWNFSLYSYPVKVVERFLSDESIEALRLYLRAIAEICGKQILFSVFFKEDSLNLEEDPAEFELRKLKDNIFQTKQRCVKLLTSHGEQDTFSVEMSNQEDIALGCYIDALGDQFNKFYSQTNMESQTIKDNIMSLIRERTGTTRVGPRRADELNIGISELLRQYYERERHSVELKIELGQSKKQMLFKYISEAVRDRDRPGRELDVEFTELLGQRLSRLSREFYREKENLCQLQRLLHSSENIILERKIRLVEQWSHDNEKASSLSGLVAFRHEDYDLIQLVHLRHEPDNLQMLEQYQDYIKMAYQRLLDYYEDMRQRVLNEQNLLKDPLDILPITKRSIRATIGHLKIGIRQSRQRDIPVEIFTNNPEIPEEIDDEEDGDSDIYEDANEDIFEEPMDEAQFAEIVAAKEEAARQKRKIVESQRQLQSELTEIGRQKTVLRNATIDLEKQYSRMKKQSIQAVTEASSELTSISEFSSIYPEAQYRQLQAEKQKKAVEAQERCRKRTEYSREVNKRNKQRLQKEGVSQKIVPSQIQSKTVPIASSTMPMPPPPPPLPPPPPPSPCLPPPPPILLQATKTVSNFPRTTNNKTAISQKSGAKPDQVTDRNFLNEIAKRAKEREDRYSTGHLRITAATGQEENKQHFSDNFRLKINQRFQSMNVDLHNDEEDEDEEEE